MTHLSWVALQGMAHSFIELNKTVVLVIRLVSFLWLWFFSLSALWWRSIRGLLERLTEGKLVLVLMGRAMLSKALIQFSVEGWSCVPSLLFDLKPNYGGGNEDNGDLLQKVSCMYCYTQCPQTCSRPPPTHASARDSCTLMGKSGSVTVDVIKKINKRPSLSYLYDDLENLVTYLVTFKEEEDVLHK